MKPQHLYSWISLLVLWFFTMYSWANSTILLPKDSFDYTISPYISIYEDETRQLTIDDIVTTQHQHFFSPSHAQALRLGVSNSNFWFRFSVTNPYDEPLEAVFTISDSDFDLINFYRIDANGHYEEIDSTHPLRVVTGGMMQFFTLQIPSPPKSTTTYLLQLHSIGLLTTHVSLMSQDYFVKNEQMFFIFLGTAVGLLLMAAWGFIYVWRRFHLKIARFGLLLCLVTINYMFANLGVYRIFLGMSSFTADKLAEFSLALLYLLHIAASTSLTWRGTYQKHIRFALNFIAVQAIPSAIFIILFFSEAAMPLIAGMLIISSLATTLIVAFARSTTPISQRWLLASYLFTGISVLVLLLTTYNLLAFNNFSAWGEMIIPLFVALSIIGATVYQIPSYKVLQNAKPLDGLEGEILSQAAKEMLTPLNSIAGINNLLRDTPLSPQQKQLAQKIQQASNELELLIQQVSDLGDLQEGRLTLTSDTVHLPSLINDVLKELHYQIGNKQIELILESDENLPEKINIDSARLRLILFNIFRQAIVCSDHGDLLFKATTYREPSLGVRIQIQIQNLAVRPESIRSNFAALQYHSNLSTRPSKHFWHFILTRFLLRKMGATVEVESMTTHGASITFSLPLSTQKQVVGQHKPVHLEQLNGKQALVIDDSSSLRLMLETQLKRWGMKTAGTNNTKEALALLRTQSNVGEPFDFLLVDHDVPILDAIKFAERIENDINISIKPSIIIMDNLNLSSINEEERSVAIHAVLKKPINTDDLLHALLEST